jgi:pyruvate/2-oxoglutarate dehydrogenase complex dihydrolipoamide acyltransferase (E2) component
MIAPTARLLALKNNIDLSSISGSGKRGTITKEDLMSAISID